MNKMLSLSKGACLILLFLSSTFAETPQNQPRLRSNGTLNLAQSGSTLHARDIFDLVDRYYYYDCPTGYAECSTDTSTCCPLGNGCCSNGYCADPGDTCCTIGTCPSGWNCCGNDGYCSPVGGECCEGGYYCDVGYQCKIWQGDEVCCPASGCVGSDGTGSLGNTVDVGSGATATATAFVSATSSASETYSYVSTTAAGYTYTSDSYEYDYYYTTYYWSYWFYFWTSYSPYTVQTVTSTETTTTTIWSVYATDSAEASQSFSYSASIYSFSAPYTATYLESSTDPVPIATGAVGTSTATAENGLLVGDGAASTVSVRAWVPWAFATFGVLVGALAFGL